jgi:hypothetical protein
MFKKSVFKSSVLGGLNRPLLPGSRSKSALRPAFGRPEGRFRCFPGSSPAEIRPGRPISGPEALLRIIELAMDVTKPYEFIGFGAMDVTKPYKFIGFGAMDATKPYKFIGFAYQRLGRMKEGEKGRSALNVLGAT